MTRPVSKAQARKNTALVGIVLALFAGWGYWRGNASLVWGAGCPSVLLLLLSVASSRGSMLFHRLWMRFAGILGYVNSRIILSVIFFVVMAPYSLVLRLFRYDPLQRRRKPDDSYWIERKHSRQPRHQFERLY